ncbi:MFS transporter [Streptomyces mauvecolor]
MSSARNTGAPSDRAPRWSMSKIMLPPGQQRSLAWMTLIDALGTGIFLAGNVVYFTRFAGLSAGQVSLGISAAGFAGVVALAVMGRVADRFGSRRVFIALSIVQTIGYAAYLLVHSFAAFFVLVSVLGFVDFGKSPAKQALVSLIAEAHSRVRVRAVMRSLFNGGCSVGSGLAALLLSFDSHLAEYAFVLGNALSFLACALFAMRFPAPERAAHHAKPKRLAALRNRPFLAITAVTGVMTLHASVLLVVFPLWIVERTVVPTSLIGVLMVVNTVMCVFLQVRLARDLESLADGSRAARKAAVLLAVSSLLMGLADSRHPWLAIAMACSGVVVLTWGEIVQAASRSALSYALAPEHAQAEYLGAFSMGMAGQSSVGPYLCTSLVIGLDRIGWAILAAVFVLAGLATGPLAHRAARSLVPHTSAAEGTEPLCPQPQSAP